VTLQLGYPAAPRVGALRGKGEFVVPVGVDNPEVPGSERVFLDDSLVRDPADYAGVIKCAQPGCDQNETEKRSRAQRWQGGPPTVLL